MNIKTRLIYSILFITNLRMLSNETLISKNKINKLLNDTDTEKKRVSSMF